MILPKLTESLTTRSSWKIHLQWNVRLEVSAKKQKRWEQTPVKQLIWNGPSLVACDLTCLKGVVGHATELWAHIFHLGDQGEAGRVVSVWAEAQTRGMKHCSEDWCTQCGCTGPGPAAQDNEPMLSPAGGPWGDGLLMASAPKEQLHEWQPAQWELCPRRSKQKRAPCDSWVLTVFPRLRYGTCICKSWIENPKTLLTKPWSTSIAAWVLIRVWICPTADWVLVVWLCSGHMNLVQNLVFLDFASSWRWLLKVYVGPSAQTSFAPPLIMICVWNRTLQGDGNSKE